MADTFDDVLRSAARLQQLAYLLVKRNQARDYIDVAALAGRFGIHWAAKALATIDQFYDDGRASEENMVAAQLVRQLGAPRPKDSRTTTDLTQYKELIPRWQTWDAVVSQCQAIADAMLAQES